MHLPAIAAPMLFVQGTRDQFGTAGGDSGVAAAPARHELSCSRSHDGDHSFKVRVKVTGKKEAAVLTEIFDTVAGFIQTCAKSTSR